MLVRISEAQYNYLMEPSEHKIEIITSEHINPNSKQIDRLLRLIAYQDGRDATNAYEDMMVGANMAFEELLLGADDEDALRTRLYSALGSLESQALTNANVGETYPVFAIGESLNGILQNEPIFDDIDSRDEAHVFHTLADIKGDLASQYDALRGYSLVKMVIPWSEHRRKAIIRKILRDNRGWSGANKASSDLAGADQKAAYKASFLELVSDLEYDTHTLEGLIDCKMDIATLLEAHHSNVANVGKFDMDDSDAVDKAIDVTQKLYFDNFMALPNLKLRDYVTIVGNTEVAVFTAKKEYVTTYIVDSNSTIRGYLSEPVVSDTFSQSYVDRAISQRKKPENSNPEDINIFGATLLLDNISILRADGASVDINHEHYTYVSIGHKGVKVYRDPLAIVME